MKPSQVLRLARQRIEKPKEWCQGWSARNRNGVWVWAEDRTARKWCSAGAMFRVCDDAALVSRACFFFTQTIKRPDIPVWNDAPERTHAEVLAAFDKAIALAEGEGD